MVGVDESGREPIIPGFRLPISSFESVAHARSAIRRTITFVNSDAEARFLTALSEVAVNAVAEHHRSSVPRPVVVEVTFDDPPCVTVTDFGNGIDTRRLAPVTSSDAAPAPDSGRGLAIARSMVPGLQLTSGSTGTVAVLPLDGLGSVRGHP